MSDSIIKIEYLSKKYILSHQQAGAYRTFREAVTEKIKNLGKHVIPPFREEFWALKDVSLEVRKGERLGIIGRNGAGKSTLLKILSRITEPTRGKVSIRGRVACLLEVGTGFHPELTGRENIYLNGSILGMRRIEIKRRFDEIVAFSEVEKFLDTPVKHYSSGMYVRLAFAVAAHLEPEIMLVDEVLAVGDAAFQKKCLGKMEDVSAKEGRTVLFVSHNMDAVSRLCSQAIYLSHGQIKESGDIETVINKYIASDLDFQSYKIWAEDKNSGSEVCRLMELRALDENLENKSSFNINRRLIIEIKYEVLVDNRIITPALNFYNERGINIFDSHDTSSESQKIKKNRGIYTSRVIIMPHFFSEGSIIVGAALLTPDPFQVHCHEKEAIMIQMVDDLSEESSRGVYKGNMAGLIRPLFQWKLINDPDNQ